MKISGCLFAIALALCATAGIARAADRECNRSAPEIRSRVEIELPLGLHPRRPPLFAVTVGADGMPARVITTRTSGDTTADAVTRADIFTAAFAPAAVDCVAYESAPITFVIDDHGYDRARMTSADADPVLGCFDVPAIKRLGTPSAHDAPLRAGKTGDVAIALTVNAAGTLTDAYVATSSKNAGLDAEALRIIRSSTFTRWGNATGCAPPATPENTWTTTIRFY